MLHAALAGNIGPKNCQNGFCPPDGILPGAKFTLRRSLAFSYIGSVTVRHCSSGHQPNCGMVQGMELHNFRGGRHLYSAGRPSHWASAHILVNYTSKVPFLSELYYVLIPLILIPFHSENVAYPRAPLHKATFVNPFSHELPDKTSGTEMRYCVSSCRRWKIGLT